ncbi:MAG TPA: cobalamin-independent methionine synthase II family protein [Chloroflexota bacterium]|nr:cobalamin-independent methionine synthase II family protein [Chloroflexota bacterium]
MPTLDNLPLLPTTILGSYALPSWYLTALEHIRRGEYGETDLRETLEDAAATAIADQERAGVDVVTDGEVRRHDFIMSFYGRLEGLREAPPRRRLGPYLYDSTPIYETTGPVSAPAGLGTVEEFRFAASRTQRPVKVACPGPLTLTNAIRIVEGYRDREQLVADLVGIVNAELRALVAAGCRFVQVDEPSYAAYWADPGKVVEVFNATVAGVEGALIGLHICFGNLRGRPQSRRTYAPLLPRLRDARADILFLEFANRELAEIDLWARHELPQALAAGVIDVKSFYRERPEDVAERLRRILEYVPLDRLWAVPDCGFWETPRWLAFTKLQALVEGAARIRRERAGP